MKDIVAYCASMEAPVEPIPRPFPPMSRIQIAAIHQFMKETHTILFKPVDVNKAYAAIISRRVALPLPCTTKTKQLS